MKIAHRGVGIYTILAAMLLAPLFAPAQVIEQVPADALMVLKITNLKAASDKIAKLSLDLGLAAMVPQMTDPLAALQVQTKMQQGVNVNGELAVAYLDSGPGFGPPTILLLVPVSDYKTFLSNWPGAQADGDVTAITLGDNNADRAFAASWGQYAAISPTRDAVAKKPVTAIKFPTVTAKEAGSRDAIFYMNMPALRPKILPNLQMGRAQILREMDRNLRSEPAVAKLAPFLTAIVNQMFNLGERFINEAQSVSIAMSLVPDGINTTVLSEFEPGTYFATNVAAVKNTDAPLLGGLPSGKYVMYGGTIADPKNNLKIVSDIVDPMLKELLAVGPEMAPAQEYVDAMKAMVAANTGMSFGLIAPAGALGAEPILQMVGVQSGDPKAISDAYLKAVDAEQKVFQALNVPGVSAMKPTYVENAKTLDGVTFRSMTIKPDMNAQNPAAMQQAQILSMLYGPQGAVVLSGTVGDKLLVGSGISDAMLSQVIASIKANSAPLAITESLKPVVAQLPKQRFAAMYIDLGNAVTSVLGYAKQFGLRIPVQLPPELPPIGVTLATDGTAARLDSHVPTMLVQSLVAAGMQAYMQMNPGAPGGLGQP